MRTLICIPTYDEADNVVPAVTGVLAARPDVHVLVVDDGSPDGTGRLADGLAAADARVHVLHRTAKAGLGQAYLAAFDWALTRGYECVVEMDADGSHRAADLGALLDAVAAGADVALGSRWTAGGRVRDWAAHRLLLSRAGNAYARVMLSLPYRDVTGGFRAFRADVLRRLELRTVRSTGYCFQIDLVRRAAAVGCAVVEVPITFVERERGTSKMSGRIVLEAVRNVTSWGIAGRLAALRRAASPWDPGVIRSRSGGTRRFG